MAFSACWAPFCRLRSSTSFQPLGMPADSASVKSLERLLGDGKYAVIIAVFLSDAAKHMSCGISLASRVVLSIISQSFGAL